MRAGIAIPEIVKQLRGINCPACIKVNSSKENLDGISCPDIIGRVINDFVNKNEKFKDKKSVLVCPDCGQEVSFSGGCVTCSNCGWSKCN